MDFKQAENRFKQLKAQFEAGTLSETEFRAQLENLMIRDKQGDWWMIGYETELWYRHDGTNWVQTDSPISISQRSTPIPRWTAIVWITLGWAIGASIDGRIAWTIGGLIGGLVTTITLGFEHVLSNWKSLLWITVAWAVGGAIAFPISWSVGGTIGLAVGGAIGWLIGGLVTTITLGFEHVLSNWKSPLWITVAWAVGGAINGAISGIMGSAIGWAVGGGIGGAIGGFVMIWQIREEKKQAISFTVQTNHDSS